MGQNKILWRCFHWEKVSEMRFSGRLICCYKNQKLRSTAHNQRIIWAKKGTMERKGLDMLAMRQSQRHPDYLVNCLFLLALHYSKRSLQCAQKSFTLIANGTSNFCKSGQITMRWLIDSSERSIAAKKCNGGQSQFPRMSIFWLRSRDCLEPGPEFQTAVITLSLVLNLSTR